MSEFSYPPYISLAILICFLDSLACLPAMIKAGIDPMATIILDVFPVVVLVMSLFQLSVLTFYKFGFWKQIGGWIMSLPLS